MIRLIENAADLENLTYAEVPQGKIKVLYDTYGLNNGYCSFYAQYADSGEQLCIIAAAGGDFLYSAGDVQTEYEEYAAELAAFADAAAAQRRQKCYSVFGSAALCEKLLINTEQSRINGLYRNNLVYYDGKNAQCVNTERVMSECIKNPGAEILRDTVCPILFEYFGLNKEAWKKAWSEDVNSRLQKGISALYLYKNVSTAAVLYDSGGHAFITQVGTAAGSRRRGYASALVTALAGEYTIGGRRVSLISKDVRLPFYERMGFVKYGGVTTYEVKV